MNVELPPFKNREHISESASTIDRAITPFKVLGKQNYFTQMEA